MLNAHPLSRPLNTIKDYCAGFRDHTRDFVVEAVVAQYFLFNSNAIVEVDAKNYPVLDELVNKLASAAKIKRPLVFLITKKYPGFLDKVNACAAGDKNSSVIIMGSWLLDNMSTKEVEGVIAHEMGHIQKSHTQKRIASLLAYITGIGLSYWGTDCLKKSGVTLQIPGTAYTIGSHEFEWIPLMYMFGGLLALKWYNRTQEKEADLLAVDFTGHKELAQSLQSLDAVVHKYLPFSAWMNEGSNKWFADHPTIEERIRYIQAYAQRPVKTA